MKITNDILKDYFYDKCSHEEEIEIQKWLTENDNSLVDQSFREIISEIQMENIKSITTFFFTYLKKLLRNFKKRLNPNRSAHHARGFSVQSAGCSVWQPSFLYHSCF